MARLLLTVLLLMVVAAGASTALLWSQWEAFQARPLNPDGELRLWLEPGSSLPRLVDQLALLGVARPSWHWRLYGRLHAPALRAGEYRVPAGSRVDELMALLSSGRVLEHRFTIVEGWTLARLRRELAADPRLRSTTAEWSDEELMTVMGCEGCFAEGRFLPETYFFTRPGDDQALLQRAFDAMTQLMNEAWRTRAPDLPLTRPEELLILGSIIERETGQAGERAKVAGVFARRLQLGMRLQTDPTVIYGLGEDFEGRLLRVHLRSDHPWNTYTRHGLPPTPIALPGRRAVEAAAQPAPGTALYFVARGDGSHQFSDTLEQHNAAVNRYIRGRR